MKIRYRYTRSYHDRHGKLRIEYRRKGKTIPLPTNVGTAEFQAAYDAAKALIEGGQSPTASATTHPALRAGTLRWLCVAYFKSAEFGQLGKVTQEERRRHLEHMLREPIKQNSKSFFGDYLARQITGKYVRVLRDRKKNVPNTANHRLKALRGLYNWAVENEACGVISNPARDVAKLKINSDGHRPWTEQDREQYRETHPLGTMARAAMELYWYTGQRKSDVARLGHQHVKNGRLCFTQFKNRKRKPVYLELPIHPELQRVLDATQGLGEMTFLMNEYGKPFTFAGLGKKFKNWCDAADLKDCSAHGLRKSAASFYAENGATEHELCAIFGFTPRMAAHYTKSANQKTNAERAMARVVSIKS